MLVGQADQISPDFSGVPVINAVKSLVAGVCDFFDIFREFDFRLEDAVFITYGGKFVDAAKSRIVLCGDQVCADAPGGDRGALQFQALDQIFVEVVGGGDHGVRKTRVIEHFAHLLGEVGEVAAVHADPVVSQRDAGVAHSGKYADCVWDA